MAGIGPGTGTAGPVIPLGVACVALLFLAGFGAYWYQNRERKKQQLAPFVPPLFSCRVMYPVGLVLKKSPGSASWIPISKSDLASGDTIKTGVGSNVHLVINGNKEYVLPEKQTVVITALGVKIVPGAKP
jgi:hypothetical protein